MKRVLLAFVVTRALAIGATHLGAAMMTPAKIAQWKWDPAKGNLFHGSAPPPFLAPLIRWDSNFYVSLAREGYPPRHDSPNHHLAFFPLYPLLLRALPCDVFWAAFLLSNLCTLAAALCMLKLWDDKAAVLFLCAPGSHFFTYPYSEALFAAALALALLLLRNKQFLAAGLAGAAASATRSPGVAAALALLTQGARALPGAVLALAGLGAFMWWCHVAQGDALAFVHLQAYHGRQLSLLGPFKAFLAFDCDPDYYLVSLLSIYLALRLIPRTPAWQWVTAVFLVLLPISTGTLNANIRYQSANVPLIAGAPLLMPERIFRWAALSSCTWMCFEAWLFGKGIGHF